MNILPSPHTHLPALFSWPRTRFGIISARLGLVAVALVIANVLTAKDGSQAGVLQLEAVLMILVAPAAPICALIAAFRDHDRSVFVWISIGATTLFLLLMFVQLTFPPG